MAALTIVYWRDIPAQVIVKVGRRAAKRHLGERFEQAIDRAAMRGNLAGTDDYLAHWRRATAGDVGDDLEAAADAAYARLQTDYPEDRLKALIAAAGVDEETP